MSLTKIDKGDGGGGGGGGWATNLIKRKKENKTCLAVVGRGVCCKP